MYVCTQLDSTLKLLSPATIRLFYYLSNDTVICSTFERNYIHFRNSIRISWNNFYELLLTKVNFIFATTWKGSFGNLQSYNVDCEHKFQNWCLLVSDFDYLYKYWKLHLGMIKRLIITYRWIAILWLSTI